MSDTTLLLPTVGNLNEAIAIVDKTLSNIAGRKTFSNIEVENIMLDVRLKLMKSVYKDGLLSEFPNNDSGLGESVNSEDLVAPL